MDKVSNIDGNIAFVSRMKGIKQDTIAFTANKLYPHLESVEYINGLYYSKWGMDKTSLEKLYEDLFAGKAIEFDLCESASPSFELKSNYSVVTKSSFIRQIRCP
jgi:hypothetical protein